MMSRQPLFRAQALQHYARGREKTVLPRFVALPVLLCLWLLLGLLLLTTALAWRIQAQRYARAEGALLSSPGGQQHATDEVQAILFVPTTPKMTRQGSGWRGWPPYCMWMMLPYARRLTPPFRPPRHMTLRGWLQPLSWGSRPSGDAADGEPGTWLAPYPERIPSILALAPPVP